MEKILTPIKSIRAKCIECSAGSFIEVKMCPVIKCPLHPYRLGHRPKGNKSIVDDEQNENVDT